MPSSRFHGKKSGLPRFPAGGSKKANRICPCWLGLLPSRPPVPQSSVGSPIIMSGAAVEPSDVSLAEKKIRFDLIA